MLTSKPQAKHRGRQKPKHETWGCPYCQRTLRFNASLFCECGWQEVASSLNAATVHVVAKVN